jgi:hypothetical protein
LNPGLTLQLRRCTTGRLGRLVQLIEPHTEADPIAVHIQILIGLGNLIGGSPYFPVGATNHHAKENAVAVGRTAGGRKGTAWDESKRVLAGVDDEWTRSRVLGGLSSGEGLVHEVRDPKEEVRRKREDEEDTIARIGEEAWDEAGRKRGYRMEKVLVDAGATDKRLLVLESEFARTLKVMTREGSTLTAIIRQAWDGPNLRVMTKTPTVASGTHISIIGHVTSEELRRHLEDTDAANGFGNRFLWFGVRRSKFLPDGGNLNLDDLIPLLGDLRQAVSEARRIGMMSRDAEARELWYAEYERLSSGKPGLLGAMLSRAEAHVLRLSMLYALADGSAVIRRAHLEAALALWDYSERSARFIFGDAMGDPTADEILRFLRESEGWTTRNEITEHFKRNKSAAEITRALGVLARAGLAVSKKVKGEGRGRPTEQWRALGRGGVSK